MGNDLNSDVGMDTVNITQNEKGIIHSSAKKALMYMEDDNMDSDTAEVVKIHIRRIFNTMNEAVRRHIRNQCD